MFSSTFRLLCEESAPAPEAYDPSPIFVTHYLGDGVIWGRSLDFFGLGFSEF